VEQFALQGSKVGFLDVAADEAHELMGGLNGRCVHTPLFLRCDLTDIAQLRSALAEMEERLGAVRVLVNNAGNDDRHKLAEVTPEYWDNRMAGTCDIISSRSNRWFPECVRLEGARL
jgi:NAD(P)-dependent dehydrogenase (short-subunit alcohol dehydrogenase family)